MNTPPSIACPACGAPASGNFCSGCGAGLGSPICRGCQAELSPEARFCHRCGRAVGAGSRRISDRAAWLTAGALCLVLVGAVVYRVTAGPGQSAAPDMANVGGGAASPGAGGPPGGLGGGAPPDISQMSPRERFDRLFNRIMQAAERGDRTEVQQFTPMALGAYHLLDTRDADARYHAAVLHLQVNDMAAALALADTILAETPGHLFGYIVRGAAAELQGDADARRQAQQNFLARYDTEMRAGRAEYADHRPIVDEFKRDAETGPR